MLDNSDGFWTRYSEWVAKGIIGLCLLAVFVFGIVGVLYLISFFAN